MLALETTLAAGSLSREILRNPYATYHKVPVTELSKTTGAFDWALYFGQTGAPAFGEVNLAQPAFFKVFAAQVAARPVADWQAYLRWHLVSAVAPDLSAPFVQENFNFFGSTPSGTKELLPRWQRCLSGNSRPRPGSSGPRSEPKQQGCRDPATPAANGCADVSALRPERPTSFS